MRPKLSSLPTAQSSPAELKVKHIGHLLSLYLGDDDEGGVEPIRLERKNGNAVGVFVDDARTNKILSNYVAKKKVHIAIADVLSLVRDLRAYGAAGE